VIDDVLAESRRELDEVQAIAHIGSWSWDGATGQVAFSDENYRIYGLAPQSLPIDLDAFLGLIDERDREPMRAAVRASMLGEGAAFLVLHRTRRPDGDLRWIEGRGRGFVEAGRVVRMVGTCHDVTERQRYEDALRETLAEVRASRARIVEAADAERRRVERDLHDGAQQRLVTLSMGLRLAQASLPGDADPTLAELLDESAGELRRAIEDLRDLARGIHPAVLTDQGLAAALESLAVRSPVPVRVLGCPAGPLPGAVEVAAYYIASEALTNAIKHAAAARVTIDVRAAPGVVTVAVGDDGAGGARLEGGSGLRGLADRVAALDGGLTVHSPPGGGTTVTAELPCA
jgi:PAS domain S-box-containing protein